MLRIQKLTKPNKRSGHLLAPGASTKIRGLYITNVSAGKGIYVDPFTRKKVKPKRKSK